MQVFPSKLAGVVEVKLPRFADDRGWFAEAFNAAKFAAAGLPGSFAQDNQSFSTRGVLRGLHYQLGQPQGKLVRVLAGTIFDVAVDIRRDSPTFGEHAAFTLSAPVQAADPLHLLWIPEGFAHGFLVMSETAEVLYKTTTGYYPQGERTIVWNDAGLGIQWPLQQLAADGMAADGIEQPMPRPMTPVVSAKDAVGMTLAQAVERGEVF